MSKLYTISNEACRAEISSCGAELRSLKKDGLEYLWQGDPAFWEQRSPLLFPFVGRFTDGKYRLYGKEYPMGIHGFAASCEFAVREQSENTISLVLSDTGETFAVYPFHFELEVRYILNGCTLEVQYTVKNRSDMPMFFGIGGHPGFRVPLEDGAVFEDYFLDFHLPHLPERIGHTESCFLSGRDTEYPLKDGRILPLRHDLFDEDAVVLRNMSRSVSLCSGRSERSVTVDFPQMPYLGIWHRPKTEAPYVCIEPWTSLPSRQDVIEEFSTKSDLIRLEPEGTYSGGWSLTIK